MTPTAIPMKLERGQRKENKRKRDKSECEVESRFGMMPLVETSSRDR